MPHSLNRRTVLSGLAAAAGGGLGVAVPSARAASPPPASGTPVLTGAASLVASGFARLAGKRVGLVTNHTGRVGANHLVNLMMQAANVRLTAIFAPEHGFRGAAEAGAAVKGGRLGDTPIPVFSLYGATKKPTADMLRDIDVLVFDIQDIGARFYTYISTMGLAMQAAALQRIPFIVLDRPNPLGGDYVSGFMMEPARRSFVGQYPVPIVHGLTVGELARMIKGERWLAGVETLDLAIVPLAGWTRAMRWPATGLPWVATSPNIPTFEAALVYPGIGLVGETMVNEGRGTPTPFSQFGAPWLDADRAAASLNALGLPGVAFEPTSYTPSPIPNVAAHPRFEGEVVRAVRLRVGDIAAYQPLEVGIHALAMLQRESLAAGVPLLEKPGMFNSIAGTARLYQMLVGGADGDAIVAAWRAEVDRFKTLRRRYLM